jgi:hypothetical protein
VTRRFTDAARNDFPTKFWLVELGYYANRLTVQEYQPIIKNAPRIYQFITVGHERSLAEIFEPNCDITKVTLSLAPAMAGILSREAHKGANVRALLLLTDFPRETRPPALSKELLHRVEGVTQSSSVPAQIEVTAASAKSEGLSAIARIIDRHFSGKIRGL